MTRSRPTRLAACAAIALAAVPLAAAEADPPFAPQPTLMLPDGGAQPRLALELETFASYDAIARDHLSSLDEFRLDRGEAGVRIGLGSDAGAELRLDSLRSAADGGELGVAGDSLVVRVKRAQLVGGVDAGPARVTGAFGVVGDPWIAALEDGDTVRPLSPTASERLLGWDPSDLSALARAQLGPARLTVQVGNGEGLDYPERNVGKSTTAVAEVVAFSGAYGNLRFAAVGRDGSRGPARVRDRRAGGGATFASPAVSAGVEVVHAWGVFDRGDATATVAGGWAEARPIPHLAIVARGATIAFGGGGRRDTYGGGIALEPWQRGPRARLRLWLAVDRTASTTGAAPLPGADPGDATTISFLVSATAPYEVP